MSVYRSATTKSHLTTDDNEMTTPFYAAREAVFFLHRRYVKNEHLDSLK